MGADSIRNGRVPGTDSSSSLLFGPPREPCSSTSFGKVKLSTLPWTWVHSHLNAAVTLFWGRPLNKAILLCFLLLFCFTSGQHSSLYQFQFLLHFCRLWVTRNVHTYSRWALATLCDYCYFLIGLLEWVCIPFLLHIFCQLWDSVPVQNKGNKGLPLYVDDSDKLKLFYYCKMFQTWANAILVGAGINSFSNIFHIRFSLVSVVGMDRFKEKVLNFYCVTYYIVSFCRSAFSGNMVW